MSATTDPSLCRQLTRRPQATTVTVKELIQKVQAGEVRIPRFQRPLRWRVEDVRRLLDSIWRGYPVGSLLFWKRHASAAAVPVGGATLDAQETTEAWWVVDGQQRTTALAASLLDLDHAGDRRWVLRFDPERQEFQPGPPPADRIGIDVPFSVLGDLRRLGRWLRDSALDDELADRVEDAQQRILDYAIPAYVVDTDDEAALRAVFARLNSTGARMRADEVFQALLGAPAVSAGPSLDLDALQAACDIDGFGQPPRSEVLKAVLAMSGIEPTRRLEEVKDALDVLVSRDDAAEALTRTVDFLIRDCGIPHVSLIPYPVVFFILARWFHLHPRTAEASDAGPTRQLLARWLWRGAASGAHQRAEVSRMREQVKDIWEDDEQGSLDRLLGRVARRPTQPWELRRFNLKSATSRIESLALLALGPTDRFGPVSVAALASTGRVAREVFATSDWRDLTEPDKALAKSAANRVLLDGRHTGLHAELRTWDATEHAARLASHLIDEPAFRSLVDRRVAAFLRRRSEAVRHQVATFLDERAGWDEPTPRPLFVYYDDPAEE